MAVIYGPVFGFDPDAADYFARIAAAGSSITETNKTAVNNFIKGCKTDGIWTAIKASCLLAGPDDLTGALVPLVGAAPTNFNFVAGDYNRVTGLVGNGSSKGLASNYAHNAAGQDNRSAWVWISVASGAGTQRYADSGSGATTGGSHLRFASVTPTVRSSSTNIYTVTASPPTGLFGSSRSSPANYTVRRAGTSVTVNDTSATPVIANYTVFARGSSGSPISEFSTARIAAYGFGESLDLALLDARLATYMSSLT